MEVILDSGTGAMCMVCQEGVVCGLMETPLEDDDFSDHVDNEVFHTFQLVQIPGETKKFYLVHVSILLIFIFSARLFLLPLANVWR